MILTWIQLSGKHLLFVGSILLAFCVLAACGETVYQTTPEPTYVPVPTVAPSPTDGIPPGEATHAVLDTRIAEHQSQIMTEVALTPPRPVPGYITPLPTPTYWLGLHEGCANNPNGYVPQIISCWRGTVNSQVIAVASGGQGDSGDTRQGLFMVFPGPGIDVTNPATEFYSTPLQLGGMRIVSVNGTRFTLAQNPYEPPWITPAADVRLVFDVATRQWLSPSPGPSPSAMPTSGPSPSAEPSPLPSPSP